MTEAAPAQPKGKPKAASKEPRSGLIQRQTTRTVALFAIVLALASAATTIWLIFALKTNVEAMKSYKVLPELGARFDAVAAAAAVGRLDVLSIILAIGAVVSAVGVVFSYTTFRTHAVEAATREMRLELPAALAKHLGEHGERLVTAALKDAELVAHINQRFTELGIGDTEEATVVDTDATWTGEGETDG